MIPVSRILTSLTPLTSCTLAIAVCLFAPAARAQCTASAGNCQELAGTNIADPRTSDIIGGAFTVADNFQPAASGSITTICFTGYYGPGVPAGANVPASGAEAFRITIWQTTSTGLPGTLVTQIFVGANADGSLTVPAYTGALSRGPNLGIPSSLAGTQLHAWTASGLSIPVTAGTCYWMEITAVTSGLNADSRWRWANSTHAQGPTSYADGVTIQTPVGTTTSYSSIVNLFDRAFCLTIGASTNVLAVPSCGVPAVPSNGVCSTALAIGPGTTNPLPYNSPANTGNFRATTALTPFCGLNLVDSNTLWYKITGDGTTFTASTCGPNTNFDTVINVYCLPTGTTDCGAGNSNLLCVANNDSGPGSCLGDSGPDTDPSILSWPSHAGTDYYIAVFGYFANKFIGSVSFSVLTDGVQANTPSCVSDRCPVDLSTIAGITEPDACGGASVDNNGACNGASVLMFSLGDTVKGQVSADAPANGSPSNNRDLDWWEYNTATPLPDNSGGMGECNLKITWQIESPMVLWFFTDACTSAGPGVSPVAFTARYRATTNGTSSDGACGPLSAVILTPSNAPFRLLVTPPDFGGNPCQTVGNNYAVKIELAPTGACCGSDATCQVGAIGTCIANGGTYGGDNVACATNPCPGACCINGTCSASASQAACAAASGNYQGTGSTCATLQCPAPMLGVCCRGGTCNTTIPSAACATNGVLAGASFALSHVCIGTAFSGCCHADYNKSGGIEVQDIFDFLNDWFAQVPFAIIGGDGNPGTLSTQNIFDFLNDWFAGCSL